jgi:hypothetical protein
MALPLEDHALVGDMRSAALVGVDGSIDWLCPPRFAGPGALTRDGDVAHGREGDDLVPDFALGAGDAAELRLTWSTPRDQPPAHVDVGTGVTAAERWWRTWAARCRHDGPYRDAVIRPLITLEAMSDSPGGGIVAAPTTSLPEKLGGVRNRDYRFLRRASATADSSPFG